MPTRQPTRRPDRPSRGGPLSRAGPCVTGATVSRGPQPTEVAPGVYCLVTGPRFLPSNVYFVRSGSSWALIDAGWPTCGRLITETAATLFGPHTRPAALLLTHVHA